MALLGEENFAFFAPKLPPNKQKCAHLCLGWHTTPPQHLNCKLPRPVFVASMLNYKHPPPLFVLPVLNIKPPPPRFVLRGGCYKVTFVLQAALPSLTAGCCAITIGYRVDHRFLKTKNIPHGYTPFCNPIAAGGLVVLLASGRQLSLRRVQIGNKSQNHTPDPPQLTAAISFNVRLLLF